MEQWKPIPEFEGYYEASNQGRIRSVDRKVWRSDKRREGGGCYHTLKGKVLSPKVASCRYPMVSLKANDIGINNKYCLVHRLVWSAFNGKIPADHEINHKDRNRLNNSLSNLECLTKRKHRIMTNEDKIGGGIDWLFAAKGKSSREIHEKVHELINAAVENRDKEWFKALLAGHTRQDWNEPINPETVSKSIQKRFDLACGLEKECENEDCVDEECPYHHYQGNCNCQ